VTAFRKSIVLAFALFFVGAVPVPWVGIADAGFTTLTQDNGIPNPIVSAIAQDGDGFVWIGTQSGVARWDGYRFHQYKNDPKDPDALADGYILALRTDRNGTLWVGMAHGGVARYGRDTDTFTTFDAHDQVRAIADGTPGHLLLGTPNGLKSLDESTGVTTRVPGLAFSVSALAYDGAGALWVGTPRGTFRRTAGSTRFAAVPLPIPGGASARIFALFGDSRGNMWIGTRGHGAYEFIASAKTVRAVTESHSRSTLGSDLVLAFAEPLPGEIWIGSYSQGVVVVDEATASTRRIRHDPMLARSLVFDAVWSLFVDRSGLIWAGTGEGLSIVAPAPILTLRGIKDRTTGISDSDVTAVATGVDGNIWVGLGSNGVDIIDPIRGRVAAIRPDPSHPQTGLPLDRVFSFAAAPNGDMFIGTPSGIYRAGKSGGPVRRVTIPGRDPAASAEVLRTIDGDLLIGSWTDGLWRVDVRASTPRVIAHVKGGALSDTDINAIEPAADGSLWIGTSSGLNLYNPRTGAIERIMPQPQDPQGLGSGPITWLMTDLQGRLWVATLGDGISVMIGRDASGRAEFRRIGVSDGLPNANADMLLRDQKGSMWVSTDNGIARIDPETFAVRAFGTADGLQISAYWGGSGTATPHGDLLFGGGNGLTIVRPREISEWRYGAPVVVTDVRVGGDPIPAVRRHGSGVTTRIDVPAGRNSVTVEFSALDYSAPAMNLYEYKLDGFDRDWIVTDSSRRTAAYTNLPPGSYRLRVRGSNRRGAFGDDLIVPIHVAAAWYQTLWFRLAEIVALVAVVLLIERVRTAYLRRRARDLERIVAERTAELELTADALQKKTVELEEASLTDPLTGLRNRRFLSLNLGSESQRAMRSYEDVGGARAAPDAGLVVFIADIDFFKAVNDVYGHAAGDAVLTQMRAHLEMVFRESDYIVRWGGEEFLVVSRGTARRNAASLAERFRLAVAETPFLLGDGRTLVKTCSIGFAALPFVADLPRAFDWEEVAGLADLALYAAKKAGRNGWVGIAPVEGLSLDTVAAIKADPNAAVRDGSLVLETNLDPQAVLDTFAATAAA
jgi:diguanylate cyclase (GGDEF)-like protein